MANISFGQNILPKTDNTYSLGNSSYKWHAYLADINGQAIEDLVLPAVTSSDNDKILKVSSGAWTVGDAPSGLPTVSSTDNGKILSVSSGEWTAITPSYLTSHQDISGKANIADLATVATSGSYNDLLNKPTIPTIPTNVSSFTNDAGYLTSHQDISGKADKVANAVVGNVVTLDANGNLIDSGKTLSVSVPNDAVFTDTTYSDATTSTHGLMSVEDKLKLDNIDEIQIDKTINTPAAIMSFPDGADNLPMALTVGIEPVQSGTDDPSPTNIRPISGWDTINIYDTKFNCYPEEWISDGYGINDTGNIAGTFGSSLRTDFFPIKANTTYYYNFPELTGSSRNNIFWYDINKTFIRVDKGMTSFQVTSPSNAAYAKLATSTAYNNASGVYNNDICLNVYDETRNGEYEAYQQGHEYEISLPQTVYGGKLTIHGDGSGELVVDRYMKAGNELSWSKGSGNNYFSAANADKKAGKTNIISDKYKNVNSGASSMNNGEITGSTSNGNLYIRDDSYADVDAFNADAANFHVVYELATPVTSQLTAGQVKTLLGVNNIWADTGDINSVTYSKPTLGLINTYDKAKLDSLATVSLTGNYNDLLNKPDLSTYLATMPTMVGATSSAAGTAGLVPAPTTGDVDKFLAGDGTYKSGGLPMVILSYGSSTWTDFINAYNNNVIVYCRASSNANPASGSQTRMAFMAYVNNATTPTNVEFQYYRSVSSHSATQMGDQVFVYKLDKTSGWSVTTREASIKQIKVDTDDPGTVSWSSNVVTLKSGLPKVTASDNGKILQVVNGAWAAVTPE